MPACEGGDFDPPAAVVRAVVRGPGNSASTNVPLLVDTGADVSLVSIAVANAVGASVEPTGVPVQFYGGDVVTYSQAHLTVEFSGYRFQGLFLVSEADYGILGRNILNLLVITLNGPQLSWSV